MYVLKRFGQCSLMCDPTAVAGKIDAVVVVGGDGW